MLEIGREDVFTLLCPESSLIQRNSCSKETFHSVSSAILTRRRKTLGARMELHQPPRLKRVGAMTTSSSPTLTITSQPRRYGSLPIMTLPSTTFHTTKSSPAKRSARSSSNALNKPTSTLVKVAYKYIGLSDSGNQFVASFTKEAYKEFIGEWRSLLLHYFEKAR